MSPNEPVNDDRLHEVTAEVCRLVSPRLDPSAASAFVQLLYRRLAPVELGRRDPKALTAAACSLLDLAEVRVAGQPLVRVTAEAAETVVEIVTDDMPFLVDSVEMELDRQHAHVDLLLHPVVTLRRDHDGRLREVAQGSAPVEGSTVEAVMRIELAGRTAPAADELQRGITQALTQVRSVVHDWQPMRDQVLAAADDVARWGADDREESAAFLRWLTDDHLTFVALRDVACDPSHPEARASEVPGSGLGLFEAFEEPRVGGLRDDLRLGTSVLHSPVHRPDRLEFVGIRRFDEHGACVGERQLLGLPTASAEAMSPRDIPVLRRKVADVVTRAAFPANSHDAKQLLEIIEAHPRDEMLRLTTTELYDTALRVMALYERPQVGVELRRAPTGRYISCLVYVPADRYSPAVADRVEAVLRETLGGSDTETTVVVNDSPLARLHVIVTVDPHHPRDIDLDSLRVVLAATARSWQDDLHDALIADQGADRGEALWRRYAEALPAGYESQFPAEVAARQVAVLDAMPADEGLVLELRRADEGQTRLTVFRTGSPLRLSDVLPVLENCGSRVVDERPYEVEVEGESVRWVYDFGLAYEVAADQHDLAELGRRFAEAFTAVWRGDAENDPLNRLVLLAGLPWREVAVLRALYRYLRQAGTPFSQDYMVDVMTQHPKMAARLLRLFHARLRPGGTHESVDAVTTEIEQALDRVVSLDEDRILRSLFAVVTAVLRTNYYQRDADGQPKPYLSVKLDPTLVPNLPLPRPMFEIWVYSPRMEGVHLRGGHVARGGIRWSDRREDFRTEILGLLKAQTVKNAVIVPVGAKGGFVVKRPPAERDALGAEVVGCYRWLIQGMLDLTDNLVPDGEGRRTVVRPPDDVVRHDGDDPYLVVAADKGTAAFSDIANGISIDYGYWLGDAFASGGSAGYDHKAMGITARGAWVSVQHHFASLARDVQAEPFTVVGVGDMSGDVFGNGMLLSEQIRLVAAFDHRHVFLDPTPDAARSFAERARLFALPRSSWDDYDRDLISAGGGVFPRTLKTIPLSDEVRALIGVDASSLPPTELIHKLLSAPVDLLWNGGIGTYVKATDENNADVGDRANDALRVNASEVRALVIGEGGNLGLTQRARIEYALAGGHVNTDAIDNSAGVDTSDHEVNIKVLLDGLTGDAALDADQRLELLAAMTDDVAHLVLLDNERQNAALTVASGQAIAMAGVHRRYLAALEHAGRLDRELELLPSAKTLDERVRGGQGLTRPELAVLLAYTKIGLYDDVLASALPDDPSVARLLARYFPHAVVERLGSTLERHPLRREIIASGVTNRLVNAAGATFVFRTQEETGLPADEITRAWLVATEAFGLDELRAEIDALPYTVPEPVRVRMALEARRLAERVTRWLLRHERPGFDVGATVAALTEGVRLLADRLPDLLPEAPAERLRSAAATLEGHGVPAGLALRLASVDLLDAAPDIVTVARVENRDVLEAGIAYFAVDALLDLDWLYRRVTELDRSGRWQALARAAARDDLYSAHAALTARVLVALTAPVSDPVDAQERVQAWADPERQPELGRLRDMLSDIRASGQADLAVVSVGLRELRAALG
ncbi:NAD-glutamate dehydrogenase [Acidothermaceae bacterium B102]|nr:NAD-glutamate dehydrogenase [Acidothermaceae bacterium B102]